MQRNSDILLRSIMNVSKFHLIHIQRALFHQFSQKTTDFVSPRRALSVSMAINERSMRSSTITVCDDQLTGRKP